MTEADQREAEKPGSRWSPSRISFAGVNKSSILHWAVRTCLPEVRERESDTVQ
jgi:hypothetical protein